METVEVVVATTRVRDDGITYSPKSIREIADALAPDYWVAEAPDGELELRTRIPAGSLWALSMRHD